VETVLSSKGQIVIPQKIRKCHGWRTGMRFTLTEEGDSLIMKPITGRSTLVVEEVIGCAGYTGPRISLEEMEAAILEEAAKQAAS
jgi:AbrB family looped-hinge helix DNA binding protein